MDTQSIGDIDTAAEVARYYHDAPGAQHGRIAAGDAMELIGSGEHRSVYLDYETDTVYKIGSDRANEREHTKLSEAREAGYAWAPQTSLYRVTVASEDGDAIECTVVAMPYLPDDGGEADAGIDLGLIWAYGGDLNTDNLHVNGGRAWLIDAGGM